MSASHDRHEDREQWERAAQRERERILKQRADMRVNHVPAASPRRRKRRGSRSPIDAIRMGQHRARKSQSPESAKLQRERSRRARAMSEGSATPRTGRGRRQGRAGSVGSHSSRHSSGSLARAVGKDYRSECGSARSAGRRGRGARKANDVGEAPQMVLLGKEVVLVRRLPPGERLSHTLFEVRDVEIRQPIRGELVVEVIYVSVDPYMWQYSLDDPEQLGKMVKSRGVGRIIVSRASGYTSGDYVYGTFGWCTHALVVAEEDTIVYAADGSMVTTKGSDGLRKVDITLSPLPCFLGVLGMPGLTAYAGVKRILKPLQGETVVVSAAAGAVGLVVCQLCRLRGARVVGSTGSDEKVQYLLHTIGVDAAFNYRTVTSLEQALGEHCPDGVDCYFDNVGGPMLDAVLVHVNVSARIASCGIISTLNAPPGPSGIEGSGGHHLAHFSRVLTRQVRIEGFQCRSHYDLFPEYLSSMSALLRAGDVRYRETFTQGIDNVPQALKEMLGGSSLGKQLCQLNNDPSAPQLDAVVWPWETTGEWVPQNRCARSCGPRDV